LKEDEKKM
jgi:hypothetical protein